MTVDESRRDDQPVGVDGALGRGPDAADLDDAAAPDADVAAIARGARAVDDRPAADQEIESHRVAAYACIMACARSSTSESLRATSPSSRAAATVGYPARVSMAGSRPLLNCSIAHLKGSGTSVLSR